MTALPEIAAEILAEHNPNDLLDEFHEAPPTLNPGTDIQGNTLFMTFPATREENVVIGRGKAAQTVRKNVWRTLAVTSEREWFPYTEDEVERRGYAYPDYFIQQRDARWPSDDMKAYIRGQAPTINPRALFDELHTIYFSHVQYSEPIHHTLVPLYVMASYVYQLFQQLPYLHFNGTAASGKTQNLRLLSALAFNAILASNITTSALFRTLAGSPGLIAIDEAESFDSERGEELRRLLNSGYAKGGTVYRTETIGEQLLPRWYPTYSPKAIASIAPLEPTLNSRCLTIPMAPASRTIAPFNADASAWPQTRNRLYLWAFQNAEALIETHDHWQNERRYTDAAEILNRNWETTALFLVLADHVGPAHLVDEIIEYFNTYYASQRSAQQASDKPLIVLRALPEVFRTKHPIQKDGELWWSLGDIHEVALAHLDADAQEYFKTRQCGRHLATLGFRRRTTHKGGTLVGITEAEVRDAIFRRRLTVAEEHAPWIDGADYALAPIQHPATPRAAETAHLWTAGEVDGAND